MSYKDYYIYGMKARPFSIGCQPMEGLVTSDVYGVKEIFTGIKEDRFHDFLIYDRKLSDKEQYTYELEYLGILKVEEELYGNTKFS